MVQILDLSIVSSQRHLSKSQIYWLGLELTFLVRKISTRVVLLCIYGCMTRFWDRKTALKHLIVTKIGFSAYFGVRHHTYLLIFSFKLLNKQIFGHLDALELSTGPEIDLYA